MPRIFDKIVLQIPPTMRVSLEPVSHADFCAGCLKGKS